MTCSHARISRRDTRTGRETEGARLPRPFHSRLVVASLTAGPHFRAQHLSEPSAEWFLATSGTGTYSASTEGPRTIIHNTYAGPPPLDAKADLIDKNTNLFGAGV